MLIAANDPRGLVRQMPGRPSENSREGNPGQAQNPRDRSPRCCIPSKEPLMDPAADTSALEARAREFRKTILQVITKAGSGHPGGSLSVIDIVTALYFHQMRHDPKNPKWPDRDRFVLSKGHACPAWYVVLAACGYFDEKHLWTLRELGSLLQGHPDMTRTPGVDMSTGSLGLGFGAGIGMALAGKRDGKSYRTYV